MILIVSCKKDLSEEVRPGLAEELARISTSILGGSPHDVEVDFNEIPKGFGFRGEPSSTSLVRGSIDGCEQAVRVKLLRKIGTCGAQSPVVPRTKSLYQSEIAITWADE